MFGEAADPADLPVYRLRERLASGVPLLAVELRPPRRDLAGVHAMEAWIDVHHAVGRLSAADTVVFLTDNAVGTGEEENLSHLVRNLGPRAVRERIVPFLTLKHAYDYCLRFAARARREQFPGLVVLGGDGTDGVPRCLPHAHELRAVLRAEQPRLLLGGWANPHRDPVRQVDYLVEQRGGLDFVLTQVLSHHDLAPVDAFLAEAQRRGLDVPLVAGVFYYRSARAKTLDQLAPFIPVPRAGLAADFAAGLTPDDVAARSIAALAARGVTRVYISNLPTGRAAAALSRVAGLAGLPDPLRSLPARGGAGGRGDR